jgi:hypothetical protein
MKKVLMREDKIVHYVTTCLGVDAIYILSGLKVHEPLMVTTGDKRYLLRNRSSGFGNWFLESMGSKWHDKDNIVGNLIILCEYLSQICIHDTACLRINIIFHKFMDRINKILPKYIYPRNKLRVFLFVCNILKISNGYEKKLGKPINIFTRFSVEKASTAVMGLLVVDGCLD